MLQQTAKNQASWKRGFLQHCSGAYGPELGQNEPALVAGLTARVESNHAVRIVGGEQTLLVTQSPLAVAVKLQTNHAVVLA